MATIATQVVSVSGGALTQTNCNAGGDKCNPGADVIVEFDNRHATNPYTVTINDPVSPNPGAAKQFDPDVDLVVPAGTKRYFKAIAERWRNPANGLVEWTYSATPTTMTVAVYTP